MLSGGGIPVNCDVEGGARWRARRRLRGPRRRPKGPKSSPKMSNCPTFPAPTRAGLWAPNPAAAPRDHPPVRQGVPMEKPRIPQTSRVRRTHRRRAEIMGLTICNRYHARVYVAIAFPDNSCPFNTGPHIMGWWGIDPGGCALVYANDVNQYGIQWWYLGEAADGAIWAGDLVTQVPNEAFNR